MSTLRDAESRRDSRRDEDECFSRDDECLEECEDDDLLDEECLEELELL
jgi:hypothetical protein